jgi:L-ascorbate metabolism protein UlaG (beta-lactamase superfamily)
MNLPKHQRVTSYARGAQRLAGNRWALAGAALALPAALAYRLWAAPRPVIGPPLFSRPRRDALTFWGHCCLYLDSGGAGIVTDPVFAEQYSPLSRRIVGRPGPQACEDVQLILVSHAHSDHLDPRSLSLFPKSALILCPPPCAEFLGGCSRRIIRPWEEHRQGDVTVTAVPAFHPGRRFSLEAGGDGRALGYVVRTPQLTIYYSGDTELFGGLKEVGRRCAPHALILNVNVHLRGRDAARAARMVGARAVIPAHHGAFTHPNAWRGPRWRRQLRRLVGGAYREMAVGGSLGFDELGSPPALPGP